MHGQHQAPLLDGRGTHCAINLKKYQKLLQQHKFIILEQLFFFSFWPNGQVFQNGEKLEVFEHFFNILSSVRWRQADQHIWILLYNRLCIFEKIA